MSAGEQILEHELMNEQVHQTYHSEERLAEGSGRLLPGAGAYLQDAP